MKKLRVIVTSVIVLVIVGGAFAFKAKCCTFCVRTGTTSGNCTTFKQNFKVTSNAIAAQYRIYPDWDGTQPLCTQDVSSKCTIQVRLTVD